MDETTLTKRLVIGLFALELIGFIFAGLLNYGQNNPSLNQLQGFENSLQHQAGNLANATNITFFKNLVQPSGSFLIYGYSYMAYYIASFINFIIKILNFGLQLIVLLGIGFLTIFDILFIVMPSLFMSINLGVFNFIFISGYALLWLVISVYAFNLITRIIGRVI
ncbi:MAG: hypothetical protein QXU98_10265 [Candidatus Parvarchaeota archaeon]